MEGEIKMCQNESKYVDMSKYDNTKAQKLRADLAELKAILYRREYEYNMLVSAYDKMNKEYEELVGISELKGAKNA